MCVCVQDVLTDLSAECENLTVEGVSGATYAHKVKTRRGSRVPPRVCVRGFAHVHIKVDWLHHVAPGYL